MNNVFLDYATVSFTPGVQVEIPIDRRWSLRPYAHLGYGWENETEEGALIWYGLNVDFQLFLKIYYITVRNASNRLKTLSGILSHEHTDQ